MPLYYGIWAFTVASANSSVIHEASIQVCESTGSEACFLACEQSAPRAAVFESFHQGVARRRPAWR